MLSIDKKSINMNKNIMVVILLSPILAFAQEKIVINEQKLKDLITDNIPSIEKINTMIIQSNLERTQYDQKYSPFINGQANYDAVNGSVFNGYQGQFNDPFRKYGISVKQNLPVGLSFNIGVYNNYAKTYNYQTNESVNSQYDSSLEAKLGIDLWKNLLGYSEKSERIGLKINEQEKTEQAKLEKIKFYNEIRKMYWRLSVDNSLIKIYKNLINQAILQEDNVRKMYKASVADRGELARSTAVVNIRKADLSSVKYDMEIIKREISNLIPELNNKKLEFQFSNYSDIEKSINICYKKIKKQKETPLNLTSYTKLIKYKDEKINADLKALERYSDADVKLEAKAATLGFGKENSNSFDDMINFDRKDYSVGLNISIPFGNSYSDTKENKMKILKMRHNSEKKEIISNLISFHTYFSISLENLFNLLDDQKNYRENLLIRVKSMRQKYNQGRISLSELIQDEDSLFKSQLNLVNTYYNIISLMIDYFSIFNDFDCEFNLAIK